MFNINAKTQLEKKLARFNQTQLALIMSNLIGIQLTQGCSIGCDFCGVGAENRVSSHIDFNLFRKIITTFSQEINTTKPVPYWASEPFDYEWEDKTFLDAFEVMRQKLGFKPYISTSIPKGKEKDICDLIFNDQEINTTHLEQVQEQLSIAQRIYDTLRFGTNHEKSELFEEFEIKDENFEKSSWREYFVNPQLTIERLRYKTKRISTIPISRVIGRVSQSHMNERRIAEELYRRFAGRLKGFMCTYQHAPCEIPEVCEVTDFSDIDLATQFNTRNNLHRIHFPQESKNEDNYVYVADKRVFLRTGQFATGECYVGELPHSGEFCMSFDRPIQLVDILSSSIKHFRIRSYIENGKVIPRYQLLGPKHIGNLNARGIGCRNGAIITPEGVYNITACEPSAKFPYGFIKEEINPENFKINKFEAI